MVSEKTSALGKAIQLAEQRKLPDWLVRTGMRGMLRTRLKELKRSNDGRSAEANRQFASSLANHDIAEHTDEANQQHYELPAAFFETVLGPHYKYSSCLWGKEASTLPAAEEEMLRITAARAGIRDGLRILDLGCGWGSFTLWAAQKYPQAKIEAVSNSAPQGAFIRAQAEKRGLNNILVHTADVNAFNPEGVFDRVVSVEMFEHVRNYEKLLKRIASWLKPDGKLFVHIFTHRDWPYLFETEGEGNWMGRYFFTGGTMPSHDLLLEFDEDMEAERLWRINGVHYARTLEAWLQKMDDKEVEILELFKTVYGEEDAAKWIQRWRMFFMASAELFAFRKGEEWGVSHYRFTRKDRA